MLTKPTKVTKDSSWFCLVSFVIFVGFVKKAVGSLMS